MHVDPAPRQFFVQLVLGQVLPLAAPLGGDAQRAGGPGDPHAEQVEGRVPGETRQQVGTHRAAPGDRVVDDHGGPVHLASPARAGVGQAVLDDRDRRPAAVPVGGVEPGDVHNRDVLGVGQRMPGARSRPGRGVMLDVDRGHVLSRHPAEPGGGHRPFLRPLQHDHVDRLVAQLLRGDLDHAGGPVPGVGPAQAERPAGWGDRHQVLVRALHEAGQPGPMQVPDQHPHRRASAPGRALS
jgi:hypothetical protein